MDTDTINSGNTETKVTFDAAQQAKVNELIREAQGRAAAEVRQEAATLKSNLDTLASELAAAKADLAKSKTPAQKADANGDIAALNARIEEMNAQHKNVVEDLERQRKAIAAKEAEVLSAKAATINVRKEVLLSNAASKINPFEIEEVVRSTSDCVQWDETANKFVVVDPQTKQPRLNSAFEPMSVDEFFQEFAAKKPYMVRGTLKSGTGSTESTRFDVANNGKYTIEQIFGPKSDSKMANDLAKRDIKEYRRLRDLAKSSGIIV